MIPEIIKFTGLDIEPLKLLNGRNVKGPINPDWLRVRFEIDHEGSLEKINRWLTKNIDGRWAAYSTSIKFNSRIIVVAFENDTDAVMFRLKGGETAWKETTNESN